MPRSAVKIGADDDFNLINYVEKLQKDLHSFFQTSNVIKTRAEHEEQFVVQYTADGKISFFNIISLGASGDIKNVHRVKFTFCLQKASGECVGS